MRPIELKILADARKAKSEINDLASTTDKSTGRMRSALSGAGKAALLGLGGGLLAAAGAGAKFAQMAIEDEASASKMAQTFTKVAGATKAQIASTEDWISAQGKALGVADDDLRPALSRLVTATGDVGKAQKLTGLAMDVSAGTGKSLEQVSTALMKAQNGQVSSLSRLGINTKNASGETISMEEATRRMADTFGGAAKTNADTLGGRIERLKLMGSEYAEGIGAKMLPALTKFAEYGMTTVVPFVTNLADDMGKRFGPIVKTVAGFVTGSLIPAIKTLAESALAGARKAFDAIRDAMDRNRDKIDALRAGFAKVWEFTRSNLLPLLGRFAETALPAIGTAIGIVIDGIGKWMEIFRSLWNAVLQPLIALILKAFAALLDSWGTLLQALGKVPGFEWAKTAGDKMKVAADKARELSTQIKDIPPFKKVSVVTTYTYRGLKSPTRGRDDDYLGRGQAPKPSKAYDLGYDLGEAQGDGFDAGLGRKVISMRGKLEQRSAESGERTGRKMTGGFTQAIEPLAGNGLKALRKLATGGLAIVEQMIEGMQAKIDSATELRDSITSLAGSVSNALTGDLFGGTGDESGSALSKFRASLDKAKANAEEVAAAVAKLTEAKVDPAFIGQLVGSGNTELIVELAGAPDVTSLAETYRGVVEANNATAELVAETVIGTRLDTVNATLTNLAQSMANAEAERIAREAEIAALDREERQAERAADKQERQREREEAKAEREAEKRAPVRVKFTAQQLDQLSRGRQIDADLAAFQSTGGRRSA